LSVYWQFIADSFWIHRCLIYCGWERSDSLKQIARGGVTLLKRRNGRIRERSENENSRQRDGPGESSVPRTASEGPEKLQLEREVAMDIVRDVTKLGPPEDTLRDGEEHYDRLVKLSTDAVIKHASGGFPSANEASAKLRSPCGGAPRQTSSELCTYLPSGVDRVRAHVRREWKKSGTCGEVQLW